MRSIWQQFRSLPWWGQALLWVLLLPIVVSVWVWQTSYPRWARLAAVGAVGLLTGIALFSDGEAETQPVAATQPGTTVTQTVTVTESTSTKTVATLAQEPAPHQPRTYVVERVIDGDTIKLASGATVRLVQIDAPERADGECFSRKATRTLERLLPPQISVRLRFDPNLDKVDGNDRRLAYVFKGEELVNLTLVRRGAASAYFFDGARGRYAGKIDAAAQEAKAAGRGLWGACSATEYNPSAQVVALEPAPEPEPVAPPVALASSCHPSYEGACLDPSASDYDCSGGSGNGPEYTGYVRVVGYDEYGLDGDGDGQGCE